MNLGAILRAIAAIAVAALAVPIVVFASRTMAAAWLVVPPPLLNPTAPTDNLATVSLAARLAPGEAAYPFFEAQLWLGRLRQEWLRPQAVTNGERASVAIGRSVDLMGTNPYAHRLAGSIAFNRALNRFTEPELRERLVAEGIQSTRSALALNPRSPIMRQVIGTDLLEAWTIIDADGRSMAIDLLRSASESNRRHLDANLLRLWSLAGPTERLEWIVRVVPDTPDSQRQLAEFLESRALVADSGDSDAVIGIALDTYLGAASLSGYQISFLNGWVSASLRLHPDDPEAPLLTLERLLQEDPGNAALLVTSAAVFRRLQDLENRRRALDRALDVLGPEPTDLRYQATIMRGDLLLEIGELDGALADFESLRTAYRNDGEVFTRIGRVYEAMGEPESAIRSYEFAVRANPSARAPRLALADAYMRQFDYLKAIEQWRAQATRDTDDAQLWLRMARAYATLGLTIQAVDAYREALDRDPDNDAIRQELATLAVRQ